MNPVRLFLTFTLAACAAVAQAAQDTLGPAADQLDAQQAGGGSQPPAPIPPEPHVDVPDPQPGETIADYVARGGVHPGHNGQLLDGAFKWDPWHPHGGVGPDGSGSDGSGSWVPPEASFHLPPGETFLQDDGDSVRLARAILEEPTGPVS